MSNHLNADILLPASRDDIPELAALARDRLPFMMALHTENGWGKFNRFGSGEQVRGNCTMVLRDGSENGPLIGFIWADDAMRVDHDVIEPWWCINAIAIAQQHSGEGRGAALVTEVTAVAKLAGVKQLYGQSVPEAVNFWKKLDFTVADEGEELRTYNKALHASGDRIGISVEPGPGDRWFVKYLAGLSSAAESVLVPASHLPRR